MTTLEINDRKIGTAHEPYIICELSGNHNGSLNRALNMIEVAASTGADAVKIQSYTPDTITIDHNSDDFRITGGLWGGRSLYELYQEAHTPFEWHEPMFAKAKECGVTLFSTPFDNTAADLLDDLGAPAFKIASFEAIDLPLIAYVARKGKPMIISTGMCNLGEIEAAYNTAKSNGCTQIVLLHCISSYPAATEDSNVTVVPHLAETFNCVSGLSDHSFSSSAAISSIALGGSVIEKHFTLARSDGGPDAAFSLEPAEFTTLVEDCKSAWKSLGRVQYDLGSTERGSVVFRRSLYVVADIAEGEELSIKNIRSIRPGHGLEPKALPKVLGSKARRDLKRGEPLACDMFGQ